MRGVVGVAGEAVRRQRGLDPRRATSGLDSPRRRSPNATSSATVGITICASGSVKQKPTRRRTSRPVAAGVEAVDA